MKSFPAVLKPTIIISAFGIIYNNTNISSGSVSEKMTHRYMGQFCASLYGIVSAKRDLVNIIKFVIKMAYV